MKTAKPEAPQDGQIEELAGKNMLRDLMAGAINELKAASDCWAKMTEEERDGIIDRLDSQVQKAVHDAVHLISSRGFVRIPATLDSLVGKDGLEFLEQPHGITSDTQQPDYWVFGNGNMIVIKGG